MNSEFDVIIIGAGAAGLMCAIEAGKRGRKVAVLEHQSKVGKKILISGGGRCNFTNKTVTHKNFTSENTHFSKSAFARYKPDDFIALVKKHGIEFHEKKLGQLFCDKTAQEIINMLIKECEEAKVKIFLDCKVFKVQKTDSFLIQTSLENFKASNLVIATGGLSVPPIGATDFGHQLAKQFDLQVTRTRPALDGFIFRDADLKMFDYLSGVSLDVEITCNKSTFRENILFTHTGLSGPAALQASLYWNPGDSIYINLLPGQNAEKWLLENKKKNIRSQMKNFLSYKLTDRFADAFCALYFPSPKPLAELSDKEITQFAQILHRWQIKPKDTVGYSKAEVTRGGVDTTELSSQTMESKKIPGLYFIGEVVDVTGWLGGYNFQWAWASGWAAGQVV